MNFKASGFIIAPFILFSNNFKNFDYNVLIENIFSKKWVFGTKISTNFFDYIPQKYSEFKPIAYPENQDFRQNHSYIFTRKKAKKSRLISQLFFFSYFPFLPRMKFKTKTTAAMINRMWMIPPATSKRKPKSHNANKMIIIVQSMSSTPFQRK